MPDSHCYTLPPDHALVLRCCPPDMRSQDDFLWPGVGEVAQAPDWNANASPGSGLHGWLHGHGESCCADYYYREGAKWLVVEVADADIVCLGNNVKFPRGTVRFIGSMLEAAEFLESHDECARAASHTSVVRSIARDALGVKEQIK